MELGVAVRSMGPQSSRDMLVGCVQAAERAGISRRHFYGKIQRYDLKADEADD